MQRSKRSVEAIAKLSNLCSRPSFRPQCHSQCQDHGSVRFLTSTRSCSLDEPPPPPPHFHPLGSPLVDTLKESILVNKSNSSFLDPEDSEWPGYSWPGSPLVLLQRLTNESRPLEQRIHRARQVILSVVNLPLRTPRLIWRATLASGMDIGAVGSSREDSVREHKAVLRLLNQVYGSAVAKQLRPAYMRYVTFCGLLVSAKAYSPAAYLGYLKDAIAYHRFSSAERDRHPHKSKKLFATLRVSLWHMYHRIENGGDKSWEGRRKHMTLARALNELLELMGTEPPDVQHIFNPVSDDLLALKSQVEAAICLFASVLGPEAVHRSWTTFEGSQLSKSNQGLSEDQWREFVLELHIEALAKFGHYESAWDLIKKVGWPVSKVTERTWDMLLEAPEHLKIWDKDMERFVMKKYEKYLKAAESTMGVEWTGGENGKHVFVDPEGIEEHVTEDLLKEEPS